MVFIAGISIALFISALLLVKKKKSQADLFLLFWMILNTAQLTLFYLTHTEEIFNYPHLLGLKFPMPLLQGVLLYYYVSSVTNQFPKKKAVALLHLAPTLITCLYIIPFLFLPVEKKIEIFKNDGQGYEVFLAILLIGIFLSGVIYVIWSSILVRKHRKRIKNQFSDIEDINLSWLQLLTYGLGAVWLLVIFTQDNTLIYSGVSVFVILIGFFGVQQKNIFDNKPSIIRIIETEKSEEKEITAVKKKYQNSGLSDELAEKSYKNLRVLMIQEKLFKNDNLTLSDLAKKLEIHPNYLSQIINEKEGKNFYDYINTYRIDEFKKLIAVPENQQFTLMALAYDCGFSSKSSFNRYFKKMTQQTPSQYAKSIIR